MGGPISSTIARDGCINPRRWQKASRRQAKRQTLSALGRKANGQERKLDILGALCEKVTSHKNVTF